MLRSKTFGLIWLWVGPTERNQEQAQWSSHAPKARCIQWAAKRGAEGLKLQRCNLLQNKKRPFSISQRPAHTQHHARPAMLPVPSSCSRCTQLPAVPPALGMSWAPALSQGIKFMGLFAHTDATGCSLRGQFETPTWLKVQEPWKGQVIHAGAALSTPPTPPPKKMGTASRSLELGLRLGRQELNRPYDQIGK